MTMSLLVKRPAGELAWDFTRHSKVGLAVEMAFVSNVFQAASSLSGLPRYGLIILLGYDGFRDKVILTQKARYRFGDSSWLWQLLSRCPPSRIVEGSWEVQEPLLIEAGWEKVL